jgi:hypothetical protein
MLYRYLDLARTIDRTGDCDENLGRPRICSRLRANDGIVSVSFFGAYPRSRISAPTNAADAKAKTAATRSAEANPPE